MLRAALLICGLVTACAVAQGADLPPPLTLTAEQDHKLMMEKLGITSIQHAGGHTSYPNWPTFLDFAARYFDPK